MPFDIDTPTGGGAKGPFVTWQSRESLDGAVPGRSFSIRDESGRMPFSGFGAGVILDIENMKTGWCYSTGQKGVAPEWQWNASLSKFAPQPPDRAGDARWQRGFSIPLAYRDASGVKAAVWEQAQAGAWQGFVALVAAIKAGHQPGKLPVVKLAGADKIESKAGLTFAPKLEVVGWAERPAALQAEGIDIGAPMSAPPRPAPVEGDAIVF